MLDEMLIAGELQEPSKKVSIAPRFQALNPDHRLPAKL
jgi:hypothetical protein